MVVSSMSGLVMCPGCFSDPGGTLKILRAGNGGDGGDASSGDAHAYGQRASAYSGPGGNAAGGPVSDGGRHGKVWKRGTHTFNASNIRGHY